MRTFAARLSEGFRLLDTSSATLSEDGLLQIVEFACEAHETFLRIHPYANGNGHLARTIVWMILARYGFWPKDWPVEPRSTDPGYIPALIQFRDGDREPLIEFMLKRLIPNAPAPPAAESAT